MSPIAISSVLLQEEGKNQKSVYYINKVLYVYDIETRYMKLKKLLFTFIIFAKKFQPYFQAYNITLLID